MKKEQSHHVITVSGSDKDICWQRSVTEGELNSILRALQKVLES